MEFHTLDNDSIITMMIINLIRFTSKIRIPPLAGTETFVPPRRRARLDAVNLRKNRYPHRHSSASRGLEKLEVAGFGFRRNGALTFHLWAEELESTVQKSLSQRYWVRLVHGAREARLTGLCDPLSR
jgi:hypothetical protein